jgi:L-asparaginase
MKLLLLTTGGTIEGNVARDTGPIEEHTDTAEEFKYLIDPTLAYLGDHLSPPREITMDFHAVCDVDSSNVGPTIWMKLADIIHEKFDQYDAFVITHGTNTLGYTSAALSFALVNPGKPIVLTGSQVPSGRPGSDALINLQNAIRVATWSDPITGMTFKGVTTVFGSNIITGTRVKKDTEFVYDAFKSFGVSKLGHIAGRISVDRHNLEKHLNYLQNGSIWRPALNQQALRMKNNFCMEIASLTEFPGMPTDIFHTLVTRNNMKGFILRAFGAGDPADAHQEAFKMLHDREIPIVVTTQAPNGTSTFQVNEPGRWLRLNSSAIPAWDMSIEAQTAKLSWLLAQKITYPEIVELMRQDLHGEIGEAFELETAEWLGERRRPAQ